MYAACHIVNFRTLFHNMSSFTMNFFTQKVLSLTPNISPHLATLPLSVIGKRLIARSQHDQKIQGWETGTVRGSSDTL